jgi:hypothetical protein
MTFDEFRDEAIRLLLEDDPEDSVHVEMGQWLHRIDKVFLSKKKWSIYSSRKRVQWTGESPEIALDVLFRHLESRRQQRLLDTPEYRRAVAEAMGCA